MYNLSTEYWDKQQEELQNKWKQERKEREQKNKNTGKPS
jgi:hypothetical protein